MSKILNKLKKIASIVFFTIAFTCFLAGLYAETEVSNQFFSCAGAAPRTSSDYSIADVLSPATTVIGAKNSADYNLYEGAFKYYREIILGSSLVWYFAEGATAGSFAEWILIQNPNSAAVEVTPVFYYNNLASETADTVTVPGQSRYTIYVNDIISAHNAVAAKLTVSGSNNIYPQRTMYWDTGNYVWAGGHEGIGISQTSTTWYFAEGCTAGDFNEWISIVNPGSNAAEVTLSIMTESGLAGTHTVDCAAESRTTVHINELIIDANVAVKLESSDDVGIAAERSLYSDSDGREWIAGHNSSGATATSTSWYFAEGRTSSGFDEYILVLNPSSTDIAEVRASFIGVDGTTATATVSIPAQSRRTIHVNDIVVAGDLAAKIESTNGAGIVAERAMYWDAGVINWAGAHCTLGAASAATIWYFAEGRTSGEYGFQDWLLLYNPDGSSAAEVTVTYMLDDGSTETQLVTVPAGTRSTININSILADAVFSIKVESTNNVGVVAERSKYWSSGDDLNWCGGSNTKGINSQ